MRGLRAVVASQDIDTGAQCLIAVASGVVTAEGVVEALLQALQPDLVSCN
jgi:hypothetical protein